MKVYKATYNMKCKNLTYEVGKTYSINKLQICEYGFHFCENPIDTLNYYDYNKDFTLLECDVLGETEYEYDKGVTNKLKVIRVIPEEEVKELLKEYVDNHKYNDKGNLIWRKYLDGCIHEWGYDDKGNLIWKKDTDGTIQEWRYKYDDKGNVIWKKNSFGEIWEWGYKYDDKGNVIWEKYPDGCIYEYEYDDKGNKIWEKDSDGDIFDWRYGWECEYDDKGNKIWVKYSDGYIYEWEYDDKGNIIEEIENGESKYKITIE